MNEPPASDSASDREDRTWAMWCHLSSFSGYLTAVGFVAGPLIVWLIRREQYPHTDDQGKEALNFNLSLFLYFLGALVLAFTVIGLVIAIPVWIGIWIVHLVFTIVAAVKAAGGERYRYPLTLRLVK